MYVMSQLKHSEENKDQQTVKELYEQFMEDDSIGDIEKENLQRNMDNNDRVIHFDLPKDYRGEGNDPMNSQMMVDRCHANRNSSSELFDCICASLNGQPEFRYITPETFSHHIRDNGSLRFSAAEMFVMFRMASTDGVKISKEEFKRIIKSAQDGTAGPLWAEYVEKQFPTDVCTIS